MTKNYRHELYRKEMMKKEINDQCKKYETDYIDYPTRIGTKKEISDMLLKVKARSCSYT